MRQEHKELLLKDLCARSLYGMKCCVFNDTYIKTLSGVLPGNVYNELYFKELYWKDCNGFVDVRYCKPYLFPLSSMSEEQKQYLKNRFCYDWDGEPYELWKYQIEIGDVDELIDWFNKNHFDYRNLIEKGLALDATNLNIY
jgi:hypothetical protein